MRAIILTIVATLSLGITFGQSLISEFKPTTVKENNRNLIIPSGTFKIKINDSEGTDIYIYKVRFSDFSSKDSIVSVFLEESSKIIQEQDILVDLTSLDLSMFINWESFGFDKSPMSDGAIIPFSCKSLYGAMDKTEFNDVFIVLSETHIALEMRKNI